MARNPFADAMMRVAANRANSNSNAEQPQERYVPARTPGQPARKDSGPDAIANPIYANSEEDNLLFPVQVDTPQLNASRGINPRHQATFDPMMDVPMPQPTPGTKEAWDANGDTWEGVYGQLRGRYGDRMDLERQLAEAEEALRMEQQAGNAAGIPTQSYLQADQKAREAREALAALGDDYDREDYQRLLNQLTTGYGAEIATDEQRQRMLDYLNPMLRRTANETRQDAPAAAIASFVDLVASPFAFGSDRFANAAQEARADWEDSSQRYRQLQAQVRGMGQFASSAEDVARNVARSGIDQFSGGFANLVKMADDALGIDPDNANWAYIGKWANDMLREKEEARQSYEKAMANASPAGRYAADLGVSTVAAIPNAAMAVMSGGASAATTAGLTANAAKMAGNVGLMDTVSTAVRSMAENPIFWESFATATGNGYESAMAKGADQNRAIMFATINGLVNAAIEMGGGIETLPSSWNNETVRSAILKWVQSANDEGMEEIKQGIVERGLENLILGADNKWLSVSDPTAVISLAGAMQEWFGGFFVGGLLGGFQSVNEIRSAADARSAAQQINEWAAQNLPQEYRPAPLDLGLAAPDLVQRYAGEVALAEINYIAALSEQQGDVRTSTNPAEVMANIGGITAENEAATAQVRDMLSQPLNRSQANKIINDPAMRAAYEAVTGTTLSNVKGEAARAVMEYSQQQADQSIVEQPQQNIDNASDLQYNDPNGGDTFGSERTGSEGGAVPGVRELVQEYDRGDALGGQELPGDQADLRGLRALSDTQAQTLTDRGIVYFDTQDVSGNNAAFSNALEEGKASQKYGPFVDSKSEEDLDGMKLFLAENGAGGFAVRSDGDIEAVFTKKGVAPKDSSAGLVVGAVAQGGTKLDCYGMVLVNTYGRGGFVPVAQVDWNQDHAPDGWTPEIGTPQVYVMMHNGDSADTVAANFGNYHYWTQAELDALPRFTGDNGYDNALTYRDMLLERQQAQQSQAAQAEQTTAETGPVETETVQPEGRGSLNLRPDTGAEPGTPQTRLSQTAETVRDAQTTPAEFAALIDQDIEKGGFRYIPITNDATVQKSTDRITKDGWSATLRNWSNDVRRGVTGAEMSAVGALLYNNAVNSGDTKLAMDILSDYMTMGRNTARGLQAMKIIQNLSPDTRLYMIERQIDKLSEQLLSKVPDGIQISETLKEQYRNATSDEVRDQALDAMAQEVADQVPATVKDKWTALRYLNMLGNFRTQGRNLIGNSIMALTTMNKNIVLRGLESIASAVSGGKYERSVSLSADPKFRQACMEEFRENEAFISGEGKYSDNRNAGDEFMDLVEDKRQIFGFKPLERYRRATNWATDAGDKIFIGPRYARSLAGYLTANGMDVETYTGIRDGSIQPTADQTALLERARNFAMKEAQESTFHDSNTLSDWVAKAGRGPNTPSFVRVLAEGLMPFRKTPANVAVRMFEYSPLGAVDTIVKAVKARNPDNDISTTQVMNSLAKTLTGTGIFFLGMLMRSAGRLRGHEDDDKQSAFDSLQGQQDYSYVTADGVSYTLDWASPVAGTLFMGSQLYDILQDGDIKLEDLGEVVTRMGDPLVQMSMLQGLKDALDALKYGDTNSIGSLALNMALSYLTQGLTNTLGGQIERTAQGGRYTTFRDSDTQFGRTMQQWLGKTLEKVPGIDYNQVEYVDAWGRTQDGGNVFARAVGNFISPGYAAQNNSTDVDDELQRLYDAGETNVFPQRIGMSETVSLYDSNGDKTGERNLTAEEYVTFQKVMGQTSLEMVRDLMNSDMYDDMTDDAKAAAISSIYQYAKNLAAQEVEPSTKKVYEDVSSLSNIGAFYGTQAAFNTAANNERNRDYDALDNLMETYGDLPADVRALLEDKKPELAKVYAASEAGISSEDYYSMTDTIKGLTAPEGYASPPTWQKFEAIGQSNLSMEEQDFFAGLYLNHSDTGGMSTYEKYMACREVDYRPRDIAAFYRIYTVTAGTDANGDGRADNGTKKKNIIAAAMAYGFSERQATELYNMFNKGSWTGK